jgi:hypothetical protein
MGALGLHETVIQPNRSLTSRGECSQECLSAAPQWRTIDSIKHNVTKAHIEGLFVSGVRQCRIAMRFVLICFRPTLDGSQIVCALRVPQEVDTRHLLLYEPWPTFNRHWPTNLMGTLITRRHEDYDDNEHNNTDNYKSCRVGGNDCTNIHRRMDTRTPHVC